jgi:hypothetical protein
MALLHPLKCGLEFGSICMAEFCQLSIDLISIKERKLKVNYRYSQAAATSPPQERFFPPAPSPAS